MSDIHLSIKPPLARSVEEDWLACQRDYLRQLDGFAHDLKVPIICAGDIFDDGWRPNRCPPELINFAIQNLPRMYAIPGQHDLPYHRYDNLYKSAYWTLVEAGRIVNIEFDKPHPIPNLRLYGFPWGCHLFPCPDAESTFGLRLAVVHKYIWSKSYGTGHAKAKDNDLCVGVVKKDLGGSYDAYVFGDNHKGFIWKSASCMNCGTFMRRHLDEKNYNPAVGVLYMDGSIKVRHLDVKCDKFIDPNQLPATIITSVMSNLGSAFKDVVVEATDYPTALRHAMNNTEVREDVRDVITKILELVQ